MENKQNDPYFDPFPTSLRNLMSSNPATGKPVTPTELAALLGTSTQTISYYINGKRKPSFDNITSLCNFFDVSADYLLFGIETEHRDIYKQTGLSNDAIDMLINAHNTSKRNPIADLHTILSDLLSDRDFYEFLEDVDHHAAHLDALMNTDEQKLEKEYPGLNVIGYNKWSLMTEIETFVFRQLKKRGYLEDLQI